MPTARTPAKPAPPAKPVEHQGVAGVAAWFGVDPALVTKWINRYAGTDTPTPTPDVVIVPGRSGEGDRGWLTSRKQEWLDWKASLPGQGAKGRPKPRRAADVAA